MGSDTLGPMSVPHIHGNLKFFCYVKQEPLSRGAGLTGSRRLSDLKSGPDKHGVTG